MKKILLIEDDSNISSNISDLLELNDYTVFVTDNGNEGVKLAKEIKPDLILCDIMMPKMSGYEVKTKLDSSNKTSEIPFIFLTAKTEMSDLRKGMILGADDYIVKPFANEDLLKSIKIRIERISKIQHGTNSISDKNISDKILITTNKKTQFIVIKDMAYIESDKKHSTINMTNGKSYFVKKTLKEWENILPEDGFKRIHQSTIINFNLVSKIENLTNRSFCLRLKGVEKLVFVCVAD